MRGDDSTLFLASRKGGIVAAGARGDMTRAGDIIAAAQTSVATSMDWLAGSDDAARRKRGRPPIDPDGKMQGHFGVTQLSKRNVMAR